MITCIWALDAFALITSERNCRTHSRVSVLLSKIISTSCSPLYKMFIKFLIVEKDDNKSAGRRSDAPEKHCCLTFTKTIKACISVALTDKEYYLMYIRITFSFAQFILFNCQCSMNSQESSEKTKKIQGVLKTNREQTIMLNYAGFV